MRRRTARRLATAGAAIVILVLLVAAVLFLPPFHAAERLAQPSFCAGCHNMRPEYAAFRLSPHAALASCNDCHLPNGSFVAHWFWDGIFGTRDLIEFYVLGRAPYDAKATGVSQRIIEANCARCHAETIAHVDVSRRRCWECHRVMYHRLQLEAAGRDAFGSEESR